MHECDWIVYITVYGSISYFILSSLILDFWTIAPYIRHRAIKYNYPIRWRYKLQVSLWREHITNPQGDTLVAYLPPPPQIGGGNPLYAKILARNMKIWLENGKIRKKFKIFSSSALIGAAGDR